MPHIQILMRKIQRPRRILLNTPMQGLNPPCPLTITLIIQKLQSRAPKAILRHKNRLVIERDFDGGVRVAVETARGVGELENVAPFDVQVLGVVGVVERGGRVGVEGVWGGVDGDAAVEDDFAGGDGADLGVGG